MIIFAQYFPIICRFLLALSPPVWYYGHINTKGKATNQMKLGQIASNMTELQVSGYTVLFSYSTPVAWQDPSGNYAKTEKKWSPTTSKHINKWLQGVRAQVLPQSAFDNIIA